MDLATLKGRFGRYDVRLYELARGIDNSEVVPDRPTQSISAEDTFEQDVLLTAMEPMIRKLAEHAWTASRKESRIARTVVLKLKTSEFKILTRSHTPGSPPASCEELTNIALSLLARKIHDSQATPALKSVAVERNLPERCASLPPWHGLHKKRESPLEALVSRFAALVVSQTYHNEVVRRDDQSGLAARTRHIERLLGHGILAVAIDPEEAAINWALVSFPGRRQRTDKFDVPVGQNPLTVPDSILKIEIPQPGPVPRRRELVPLRQKISKRVRFQHHRPDADLVEESALREGQILLPPLLDAKSNEIVDQYRVGVAITAHRVGRPL